MIIDPNNNNAFFLELGKDYPVWDDNSQSAFIDRKLEWYFCGETKRSRKELIEINKQIKQYLKVKAQKIKKNNPKLSLIKIVNHLWNTRYNRFDWQREQRKNKYVNNLEFIFNQVFCEMTMKANWGDKSEQELSSIYLESAKEVSSRLYSIIKRNALNVQLSFPLPENWNEGKILLSKWLTEKIPEFSHSRIKEKKKNLRDSLKDFYGLKKINKERDNIPEFAKIIFSTRKFQKYNGEYYSYTSIKRELYNLLGMKE